MKCAKKNIAQCFSLAIRFEDEVDKSLCSRYVLDGLFIFSSRCRYVLHWKSVRSFTLIVPMCFQTVATKSELPIGVLRGCPSCRTCQKVKLGIFHFDMLDPAFCGSHDLVLLEP